MDLGAVVGFDPATSDPQSKWYGSGFQRSVAGGGDEQVGGGGVDDWKKGMLSFSTTSSSSSPSLYPSKAQKTCNNSLPYFHLTTAPPASSSSPRNSSAAGQYYPSSSGASLSFNGGTMMMMHGGSGGVFTPSQWMELEHQALIYKYLTSNVPVPLNLLIPIRKALESAAFSSSSGFLRPNALGWVGPFHLGFSSNSDPEPGRCRRTDGKKWRCSRDAVPDQKYCERHINRGRHRSRKPVEVRSAQHSVASTTNNITAAKAIPAAAAATTITAAAAALAASRGYGGGSSSNVPAQSHHHHNNADLLASIPLGRMFVDQINGGLKSNESSLFMISKQQQQHNPYAESSSRTEFGLVSSESLLNPSQKPPPSSSPTLMSCRSFSSHDQQQHSLRQFMDDWPKIHQPDRRLGGGCSSNSSSHSWQETADRTQLSISIATAHNAAADFMSSSSSPEGNNNDDKVNVSPLRPSGELDSVHRQANWDPISWENSMGGPLGEVLQSTNNNGGNGRGGDQCKVSNSLSLMTEGWDSGASSPTGVLQRTTFVSLSNSSAGSSPRAAREQH